MKALSPVLATASGSLGGLTVAAAGRGLVLRSRGMHTNPRSSRQAALRSIFTTLLARWRGIGSARRAAWASYAEQAPNGATPASPKRPTGRDAFVACNTPRLQIHQDLVDDAPTDLTVPDIGDYTWRYRSGGVWRLTFDDTQPWTKDRQSCIVLYLTAPQSPMVNHNRQSYRLIRVLCGTPPPFSLRSPFRAPADRDLWVPGRTVFARYFFMLSDGRTHAARIERNLLLT